jgi:hypothetical protein
MWETALISAMSIYCWLDMNFHVWDLIIIFVSCSTGIFMYSFQQPFFMYSFHKNFLFLFPTELSCFLKKDFSCTLTRCCSFLFILLYQLVVILSIASRLQKL